MWFKALYYNNIHIIFIIIIKNMFLCIVSIHTIIDLVTVVSDIGVFLDLQGMPSRAPVAWGNVRPLAIGVHACVCVWHHDL